MVRKRLWHRLHKVTSRRSNIQLQFADLHTDKRNAVTKSVHEERLAAIVSLNSLVIVRLKENWTSHVWVVPREKDIPSTHSIQSQEVIHDFLFSKEASFPFSLYLRSYVASLSLTASSYGVPTTSHKQRVTRSAPR
jgi:hypothetical protein